MRAKFVNESLGDVLKPKSEDEIISKLASLTIKDKNKLLRSSAFNGQYKTIEHLIKANANINSTDEDGWTPLMWAITNNKKEVIQLFLDNGAHVNIHSKMNTTPLSIALMRLNNDIIELLKKYGAKE